jgi:cytidylate kinase
MGTKPQHGSSEIAKHIERQIRNWELARDQAPKLHETEPHAQVHDFVTISRMVGAGGHTVATALGEKLHWPVFDREILQAMAGDDRVRARLYEFLDERDRGWIEDTLRWLSQGEFRRDDYFHRLSETILALARKGRAIFLGRGADLILPRERGLRVYLVASTDYCAGVLARRDNISVALAHAEVERIQHERIAFLRHHHGKIADHPARNDLTINVERFSIADVVELICHALRIRGVKL